MYVAVNKKTGIIRKFEWTHDNKLIIEGIDNPSERDYEIIEAYELVGGIIIFNEPDSEMKVIDVDSVTIHKSSDSAIKHGEDYLNNGGDSYLILVGGSLAPEFQDYHPCVSIKWKHDSRQQYEQLLELCID